MKENLQSLSYDELRSVWKDFLATLDVADSTRRTMYTDAFYLWRHNNSKELFWSIVLNDNFEETAKRNISNTLIRDSRGDKATLINGYYYHLKKFREFVFDESTSTRVKEKLSIVNNEKPYTYPEKEVLQSLSYDELRRIYKAFIEILDVTELTKRTVYTDTFYLWRHNNKELFWSVVLDNNFEEVAKSNISNTLRRNSKGDTVSLVSGYYSHLKRFREFVLGEPIKKTYIHNEVKRFSPTVEEDKVPYPSVIEVEKYLKKWDALENYHLQESALNKLFHELCPCNKKIEDVLLKSATLNDFYSTNIYSIYPVAKHIVELNIDDRLQRGDIGLVNEIQQVMIGNKIINFYSFATKYCSHHKPEDYPIYDSYVEKVLCYFQRVHSFSNFRAVDLKNYIAFKSVLEDFRNYYKLTDYSLKQIDQYIWQLGKEFFPNKYYK